MRSWLQARLIHFVEEHERSIRTELLLVPILVLSLKLFGDAFHSSPWWLQVAFVIGASLASYIASLFILIVIGDAFWNWVAQKISPLKKFCGIYVQRTGADGRQWAISRFYYDSKRKKFVYRGIAYAGEKPYPPAASWDQIITHHSESDSRTVVLVSGKSIISDQREFDPDIFENPVFSVLYFTGDSKFRGAGFDCASLGDYRADFPISGSKVDKTYLSKMNIDLNLLRKVITISDRDRKLLFNWQREESPDTPEVE